MYGKSKASVWRNLNTGAAPKFFGTILCFVTLVYNLFFFYRTAVLRKLFEIRFSYKHRLPTRQDGVENRDKAHVILLENSFHTTVVPRYNEPLYNEDSV